MSDKRATYVIGAVAAAFALVFGLITAVPASTASVNSSAMDMMGHAVVVLKDMDGNVQAYQQTDNLVVRNGQNCAADLIFGQFTATGLCAGSDTIFDDIRVGSSSAAEVDTQTTLQADLGGVAVPAAGTGNLIAETGATASTGALKTIEGTFVLTAAATVAEVGLFDGPGATDDMFSRIVLGTPISAGTDDVVTITYVIEVG